MNDLSKDDLNRFSTKIMDLVEEYIKNNNGNMEVVDDLKFDLWLEGLDEILQDAFPNADYTNYN